jgi:molybdate transport system ATP-binding protein
LSSLAIRLRHAFGAASIDVTLDLPGQGVTAIFGPSGAGKSVLIQALAGLFRPQLCRFATGNRVLADTEAGIWLPPEQRRLGLVFQDARLFPHMSVEANLRFGQRRNRRAAIAGFDEVIDLLGLTALLGRRPHTLSGGERQRVGIGRALLSQPDILLMDEPLASLDQPRREEILPYLRRLTTRFRIPMLYVTHAIEEVAALADHVVLLRDGRVVASAPLREISARGDLPLAQRDDAGAILTCTIASHDHARSLTTLAGAGTPIVIPLHPDPPGTKMRIRIPAREVILATPDAGALAAVTSLQNVLPGIVRAISPDHSRAAQLLEVELGDQVLLARVTEDALARLGLAPGAAVLALFKSVAIEVIGGD